MENLLVAENIYKRFGGYTALNNVSITIPKGSVFGLLGPNGAGKTTFIRIINQITMPDEGQVYLDGRPLHPEDIQHIGYLPEERGLYKSMKVGEQALYLARLKGLSKAEAKQRLQYWFEKLEITGWWDKKIQELSKGMAQKVQFVITVLHNPKLLIFDEPFSGFDPVNANIIKREILELKEKGATILFSTHRMESVEELCDYMALINKSNKLLDGKVSEIKKEYKNNTFEVGLECEHEAALMTELQEKFKVGAAHFKSINDDLKVSIQLQPHENPNDLIQYLLTKARINHFVEVIPSVNDIFIKTVTHNA
ncbi:MAG: ABC transporter ATP-binding protein [Zunongwangia sp.]|mgnify:FL=1|jgi:ABC-2 type transport system ATP-binding protein|uniref:ABC transporter ATP-binding protein n=1 Tax=Zunongwangia profunda TaxID=398743 RepID=UPI000C4531AF|nr:ATP-binding cassette domain-containing protein [Zunongwangia profunda]MAO38498.1 ABC transporter ATP-binding protein [Zunongwangia sp.]MAS71818.1 ABC transporter ATP-binding protein [Zunongwangia sp.]MCC4228752.1 ATP-binding cassette domain-containing protein [Zunongwangia profunda]|tara:strand:+ start:848 stop:1777 length:930 start_codon:yes stop_codon:yes gene_type:complete